MAVTVIKWYEWLYKITDNGKVISLNYKWTWKEREIKWIKTRWWYLQVELYKNCKRKKYFIHRLIAQAFLWFNINSNLCVCHKDDNPKNNNLQNLFIWTQKNNIQDMIKKWRKNIARWNRLPQTKLKNKDVKDIKKYLRDWVISLRKLALMFNVSKWTIDNIKYWKSFKYIIL